MSNTHRRECLGADTAHACMCACACNQAERAKWVVDKALEEKKSIVISAKGEAEALGGSLCQDGAGWLNACTETDQSGVFYMQEWRRGQ